ncbi:hypothetical protein ABZ923_36830 [Streptomyces sp. NPDC046881]|uniref:hypothetical protein n=1 Tax=Streptomyces sp. NPDC046881 TaxID=3155374 RepID=UPI0033EA63DC
MYDPDTDDVVQAELAAEAATTAEREAALREAQPITTRADELQALRELGTLEQTEPREGDEAVRDELTRRTGSYVQANVDAWLAQAMAAHRGHYAHPAAREAAAGLLPQSVQDTALVWGFLCSVSEVRTISGTDGSCRGLVDAVGHLLLRNTLRGGRQCLRHASPLRQAGCLHGGAHSLVGSFGTDSQCLVVRSLRSLPAGSSD